MAALSGHQYAWITARCGVLRCGTGRAAAVGDAEQIYLTDGTGHYAGEFKYSEASGDTDPEDAPSTTYTSVAR
ncbi:MAG TPA: hypothetical protein VGQ24_00650 [Gemmatimonadales bacterium]|jgi:hypothetical protein|nr:hypothetical protein [Gemmatimonadales bacterium]